MRERLARAFAVGLALLVVGLAAWFAERQNAPAPDAAGGAAPREPGRDTVAVSLPLPTGATPAALARGRAVFEEQGCARCHSVGGTGNPRSPLDGVGTRLPEDRVRAFVIARDDVRGELTPSVVRAKARFAELPPADLDALVAYLMAAR